MLKLEAITSGTLENLLIYVSFLGLLLLIASLIRLKVGFLKKYYIPASLIAGLFGLLLGPFFLKVVPQEIMSTWSSLSGVLMTIVLAPAMMGVSTSQKKGFYKKAISAACYTYSVTGMQFAVPILLTLLLFTPLWGVNPLFASTFECGWAGSHGLASAMSPVFEQLSWQSEGTTLCLVNATFGLITGVVAGVILINVAVRKGWSKCLKSETKLTNDEQELHPAEDSRKSAADDVVSSSVIDTLAFHAAILAFVLVLGYILSYLLSLVHVNLPWFCCSVFAGFFTQKCILDHTRWGKAVDRKSFSRIQGLALEFVVAGGIASLNLSVVLKYALPLFITTAALVVLMVLYVTVVARRCLGYYWFENAMIFFGAFTGAAATGMTLLKTCDPKMESDAAEIYAARLIFTGFATGGGIITVSAPLWLNSIGTVPCLLIFLAMWIVPLIIPELLGVPKMSRETNG